MHFVPPLSSILPSGNETMVPFAKLLSLSSKPTAVFCCDARVPQVRLSARLLLPAGTGGVGKARTGAAVPALCSCSRCGSSGSAQRGSCYSLGFFWRPQSQPRGTHGDTPQVLRCQQQPSNVLSSESGSQSCGALLGVSGFRSPDSFPLSRPQTLSLQSPIRKYLALCLL